jgi:hypothetical protein
MKIDTPDLAGKLQMLDAQPSPGEQSEWDA